MNITKKLVIGIISVLAIFGLLVGGKKIMRQVEYNEMEKVVYSEGVKDIIENYLKFIDDNAFTPDGKIQSYTIERTSIKKNPMGGIMFSVFVNEDPELYVRFTLEKNLESNEIGHSGGGYSSKLKQLVRRQNDK